MAAVLSTRGSGKAAGQVRHRAVVTAWLAGLVALAVALPTPAAVLITQEEALDLVFPGAEVSRHTAYLDEEQLDAARRQAGGRVPVRQAMVPYYRATRQGKAVGVAYFDTHLVRTEAATVMYVVDPESRLERVEIIAFNEPPDYLPRQAWLDQFRERALDGELAVQRGIRSMTGATLTARSITEGARRILALHAVIAPWGDIKGPGDGGESGRTP